MSKQTENLKLHLYDTGDKFNITAEDNSLNNNMELIDAAISSKANLEIIGEYAAPMNEFYAGTTIDALSVGNSYYLTYEPGYPLIFYTDTNAANNGVYACVIATDSQQMVPNGQQLYQEILDYGTNFANGKIIKVQITDITNDTIKFHNFEAPIKIKDLSDKQDKFADVTGEGRILHILADDYFSIDANRVQVEILPTDNRILLNNVSVSGVANPQPDDSTSVANKHYVDRVVASQTTAPLEFVWTIQSANFSQQSGPWATGVFKVTREDLGNQISYKDTINNTTHGFQYTPIDQNSRLKVGDYIYVEAPSGSGTSISLIKTFVDKQDKLVTLDEISDENNSIDLQIQANAINLTKKTIETTETAYDIVYEGGSGHQLDTIYIVNQVYDTGVSHDGGGFSYTCGNSINLAPGTKFKFLLDETHFTTPEHQNAAAEALAGGTYGISHIKLVVYNTAEVTGGNMPLNGVGEITSDNLTLNSQSNQINLVNNNVNYRYNIQLTGSASGSFTEGKAQGLSQQNDTKYTLSTSTGGFVFTIQPADNLTPILTTLKPGTTFYLSQPADQAGNATLSFDAPGMGVKIINVATPTDDTDAVNKAYVDSLGINEFGTIEYSGGSEGSPTRTLTMSAQGAREFVFPAIRMSNTNGNASISLANKECNIFADTWLRLYSNHSVELYAINNNSTQRGAITCTPTEITIGMTTSGDTVQLALRKDDSGYNKGYATLEGPYTNYVLAGIKTLTEPVGNAAFGDEGFLRSQAASKGYVDDLVGGIEDILASI